MDSIGEELKREMESSNNAEKVAEALRTAFSWKNTKEGYIFWEEISKKLMRIANEGY